MLAELEGFQRLCSSLSRITPLRFDVRDPQGRIVFSTGNGNGSSEGSAREDPVIGGQAGLPGVPDEPIHPCRGLPMTLGGRTIGSLVLQGGTFGVQPESGGPTQEQVPAAKDVEEFFHQLVDLMLERSSLRREMDEVTLELANAFEDLHLFSQVSKQVQEFHRPDAKLDRILEDVRLRMNCDLSFFHLPEHVAEGIRVLSPRAPTHSDDHKEFMAGLLDTLALRASTLEEDYFVVNDSREEPDFRAVREDPYRFLAVRVRRHGRQFGWVGLVSFDVQRIFREGELRILLALSDQVGSVITNKELYRDLELFVINMVHSLVNAIEAKDMYTRGHSERVSRLAGRIGRELDLPPAELESLRWASVLHDIGKIGISEAILNKPGRLSDEERLEINHHPTKGCKILEPIQQLKRVLPGILHHHERYDGEGYPEGLKGEAIPLIARIIAVADTYDAITSTRAYRPARPHEETLAIIRGAEGSQLDPAVVRAFWKVLAKEPETETASAERTGDGS